LGPVFGHLSLGYQHALNSKRALIAEIGFIGIHLSESLSYNNSLGAFARLGYRFKKVSPNTSINDVCNYNLGGFYIQPEVAFSSFKRDYTITVFNSLSNVYVNELKNGQWNSGAFLVGAGRQMVIKNIFSIDLSAAVGLGFSTYPNTKENSVTDFGNLPGYYFSHSYGGIAFPLAWKLSFSVGLLLK